MSFTEKTAFIKKKIIIIKSLVMFGTYKSAITLLFIDLIFPRFTRPIRVVRELSPLRKIDMEIKGTHCLICYNKRQIFLREYVVSFHFGISVLLIY